jgi:hypothetical protein
VGHPMPNVTFDSWLYEISVSIEAALECDLYAETHLARIARELATPSGGGAFFNGSEADFPSLRPQIDAVWAELAGGLAVVAAATKLVRPYALTGGRARSEADLALEALVAATTRDGEAVPTTSSEWQTIIGLCQQVRSVAEIAAYRGVPVGVARVVVGDMAEAGLLDVREPARLDGTLGRYLLQRVLQGLRQL